jgi:hypothetical protein
MSGYVLTPTAQADLTAIMRDYLILYKPDSDPLQIVTIVRGSRDIPTLLSKRGL